MEKSIFFLICLASRSFCCVVEWDCAKCVENYCIYAVTKSYKTVCVSNNESISKVKAVFDSQYGCKMVEGLIERNNKHLKMDKSQSTPLNTFHSSTTSTTEFSSFRPTIVSKEGEILKSSPIFNAPSPWPAHTYDINGITTATPETQEAATSRPTYTHFIHSSTTMPPRSQQTANEMDINVIRMNSTTAPKMEETTTTIHMHIDVINRSSTTFPKLQETTTGYVAPPISFPDPIGINFGSPLSTTISSTSTSKARDRTLTLSDAAELFLRLPTFYDCPNGERNETLIVAYASSLCTIAKLSQQYGIDNFSDSDKGWFYLNPARRYNGMCTGIRQYRKRCRISVERKIRQSNIGLHHGQRSALFQRVDSLWHCGENESEGLLNRLARIICYSGELFLELEETTQLHTFDLAFGLRTPAFRHAFKCSSLFYKKRRCYN